MNRLADWKMVAVGVIVLMLMGTSPAWSQAGGHASVGLGHGEEGYLHLQEMIKHLEFSLKMDDASFELKSHGSVALGHAKEALKHYNEALAHASESLGRPARGSMMGEGSGGPLEEGSNSYGRPREAPPMQMPEGSH